VSKQRSEKPYKVMDYFQYYFCQRQIERILLEPKRKELARNLKRIKEYQMAYDADPVKITISAWLFAWVCVFALMMGLLLSVLIEAATASRASSEEIHLVDNYLNNHYDAVGLRNKFDSIVKDYPPRRADVGTILLDANLAVIKAKQIREKSNGS
jgi:hypothetical protein